MRSAKKKAFSNSRKKSKYKIRNWSIYNASLKRRGNIDFMIASNLSEGWYEKRPDKIIRGRAKQYSDFAIEQCLKIRS